MHSVGSSAGALGDQIADVVHHIRVVAQTANQRVGTEPTIEHVVDSVAGHHIVEGIAGAIDRRCPGQGQVLDVRTQGVGHRRLHRIGAFIGILGDQIADVVHHIGVVTQAARQRVSASPTIEYVVAGIAGHHVVQDIAGAIDRSCPGQSQVLDIASQRIGDRRLHCVGSSAGALRDQIAGVVHHVGVVAQPADQCVSANTAIEYVVAGVAGQHIVQGIAGGVDRRSSGQGQVLDIGAQRIGDRRLHYVGARACRFGHDIARIVDDIGVVASSTNQCVGTDTAIKDIGATVASQQVVVSVAGCVDGHRPGQGQVLDIRTQCVTDRCIDAVRAFVGILGDYVRSAIHDIGVVADATDHRIVTRATVQRVVAGAAGQRVGSRIAGQHIVERITGGIDSARSCQCEAFYIVAQRVRNRSIDKIAAFIRQFNDNIANIIDRVSIVTTTAGQAISVATTIQRVITFITIQGIPTRCSN